MRGVKNCEAQAKGKVKGRVCLGLYAEQISIFVQLHCSVCVFKTFVYFINIYIRANATDTLIACLAKNSSTDVDFFLSFH